MYVGSPCPSTLVFFFFLLLFLGGGGGGGGGGGERGRAVDDRLRVSVSPENPLWDLIFCGMLEIDDDDEPARMAGLRSV